MLENKSNPSATQILSINPAKVIVCCALLLLGISIPTPAQRTKKPVPCADVLSQADMNICWGKEYKKADVVLNDVYRRLVSMVDEQQKAQLKEAQLAWLKYRDTNCEFVADQYHGGSLRPTVLATCLLDMTTNRTVEMKSQIKERTF